MSNPISAVTPSETPQAGVKRGLQGNPTSVPRNLPAFRGRKITDPSKDVKVPGLSQGNKPNQQTNIRIPYSRIAPLEFLSQWSGRLSPGDVAFVQRVPVGFSGRLPGSNTNKTGGGANNPNDTRISNGQSGQAMVTRVIGIDGLNRLLHGATAPGGWVEGVNVFRGTNAYDVVRSGFYKDDMLTIDPRAKVGGAKMKKPDSADQFENFKNDEFDHANPPVGGPKPAAPAALVNYMLETDASKCGPFRLSILNDYPIDGVVISNDEPESYKSNGERDATIFNIAIQGPTLVNNGYLKYTGSSSVGSDASRLVEAYPRGNLEAERHILSVSQSSHIASKGGSPWLPNGAYDYVAAFTGGYTAYPQQMFDRSLQPMNELFVGIRAFQLVHVDHTMIKSPVDGSSTTTELKEGESFWFYQLMPFASHKAWYEPYTRTSHFSALLGPFRHTPVW